MSQGFMSVGSPYSSKYEQQQQFVLVASDVGRTETASLSDLDGLQAETSRRPSGSFGIDPFGSFYYWWSAVVSLAFSYNLWTVPYRFAIREIDSTTRFFWISSDVVANVIYIMDMFVSVKMAYLEDGVLVWDKFKIREHYVWTKRYLLDLCCMIPAEMFYYNDGYKTLFRCNSLLKVYKFWYFVGQIERHTNYPNLVRSVILLHTALVTLHWNACFVQMALTYRMIDIDGLLFKKIGEGNCSDAVCHYFRAFYWSFLSITGRLLEPKTKGEHIFAIVEPIFGIMLLIWLIAKVINIVATANELENEFKARLDAVKTIMRNRRVSAPLRTKVIRWFDYLWNSRRLIDEDRLLSCLPDRLKAELAININLDTLKRVDIFYDTEVGFLRQLVLHFKPVLFSPGDYVCRKGEVGHEMYIVSSGLLEVVTDDGQMVVAVLKAGSYFGEIALLSMGSAGNRRTASVRSIGYSELACLGKHDLWALLRDYPQAEARIREVAEERLSAMEAHLGGGRQESQRSVSSQAGASNVRELGS